MQEAPVSVCFAGIAFRVATLLRLPSSSDSPSTEIVSEESSIKILGLLPLLPKWLPSLMWLGQSGGEVLAFLLFCGPTSPSSKLASVEVLSSLTVSSQWPFAFMTALACSGQLWSPCFSPQPGNMQRWYPFSHLSSPLTLHPWRMLYA